MFTKFQPTANYRSLLSSLELNTIRSLFLVLSLVVSYNETLSQTDYSKIKFQRYTISDGLVGNHIMSISQDNIGYIWIGTRTGLSRFDGLTFMNFERNSRIFSLKNEVVMKTEMMNDTLIGVSTQEGGHIINTHKLSGYNCRINDTSGFSKTLNNIIDIKNINNGNTFLLTKTGYYLFNPQGKIIYRKDYISTKELLKKDLSELNDWERKDLLEVNDSVYVIYGFQKVIAINPNSGKETALKNFELFKFFGGPEVMRKKIGRHEYIFVKPKSDSIYYLNSKEGIIKGFKTPPALYLQVYYFNNIYEFDNRNFCIPSFNGGIYIVKVGKEGNIEFDPVKKFSDIICHTIFIDKEGRLWLGTQNGLLKERNYKAFIKQHEIHKEETDEQLNSNIYILNNKIFVAAEPAKYKIKVLDLKTKEVIHQMNLPGVQEGWPMPFEMTSFHKDTLWVGTVSGIFWIDANNYSYGKVKVPKPIEKNVPLTFGKIDGSGFGWICGIFSPHYVRYDPRTREFTYFGREAKIKPEQTRPVKVVTDSNGDVWFCGYGLQKWDTKKNRFDTLIKNFGKIGEHRDFFRIVEPDKLGNLWLFISGLGFLKYNVNTKKVELEKFISDLPSLSFNSFSAINRNKLWYGFSDKLVCYDVVTKKSSMLSQSDGMPEGVFSGDIVYDSTSNSCLAFMGKTLLSFSNEPSSTKKTAMFDYVLANNVYVNYNSNDTIKLNYNENTLSIKLGLIDFNQKYAEKFSYEIDNNGLWNNIDITQPIFLYNLTPGWHVVNIKSFYLSSKFNPKQMFIYIEPPFWRTIPFLLLVGLFTIISLFIVIKQIIKRIRKENDLLVQLKEFEIKALHAQMNPHFIFNCLNSIKALVLSKKNDEASRYINGFSKLVRLNLEHSRRPFISLKDNIDYIALYLESEKLRFTNFKCNVYIDKGLEIEEVQVVPMLIQPIVENAIWHGLQHVNGERVLNISYEQSVFGARCIIEDNGIGINKSIALRKEQERKSVGMENIKERILLFNKKYNLNYKVEVIDKSDFNKDNNGTIVIIHFNTK